MSNQHSIPLVVEVEFGAEAPVADARWATLKIGGARVFTALVVDTDLEGKRTDEQAALNLLRAFGRRLGNVLGDDQ